MPTNIPIRTTRDTITAKDLGKCALRSNKLTIGLIRKAMANPMIKGYVTFETKNKVYRASANVIITMQNLAIR